MNFSLKAMSAKIPGVPRPTQLAHQFLTSLPLAGARVVDATLGNGYDARFLAGLLGAEGVLTGFDVQALAVESSRRRVQEAGFAGEMVFYQESHARMREFLAPNSQRVVVFNLGYLPGGDEAVITESSQTLAALDAAAEVLEEHAWLLVTCYVGHEGGQAEGEAVEKWFVARAEQGWRVAKYQRLGTRAAAPFLLVGVKKSAESI